jgi:uncharacterized cupredoxin-like copper-binding protein
MSTTSPLLRLTLQALDENQDTWGNVLNVSALQLLEDGIAGAAAVVLASAADYTLQDDTGGPSSSDGARYAILDVSGSPGGTTNIIVPTRSKIYLLNNQSDESVVPKTVAGTGPTIIAGEAQWVFCDGTDVLAASAATAVTAGTATLAADSTLLGGTAASAYAQKAQAQTFTKGQVIQRVAVTTTANVLTLDCSLGNTFYLLTTENFTMAAPTNATNGQTITLAIEQGGGGPHTIGFTASTFQFAGGTAPVLSTIAAQADYLAFEYVTNLSGGARWWGSQLKTMADV